MTHEEGRLYNYTKRPFHFSIRRIDLLMEII